MKMENWMAITYKDIMKNKTRPNSCKDHSRLRVAAAVGVLAMLANVFNL